MVTEAQGESYEDENDTDTGADPDEDDDGPEGDEGGEPDVTPEPDYKAELEKVSKLNADKANALRSERTRARNAEKQLAEMRAEIAALKAPKTEIPDPNEDPIGAIEALRAALLNDAKAKGQNTQADQIKAQNDARVAELAEMEAEYSAENPEYNDAAAFFGEHLKGELAEQGLKGGELDQAFGEQLMKLVANAEKAGKHPGDVIMSLAKKNGFGKAVIDKGAEKVNTMKAAKAASASIGNAPSTGERNITMAGVLATKLGTPERAKAFAKLREAALREERRA